MVLRAKPVRFYLKILRFVDKPEFCETKKQCEVVEGGRERGTRHLLNEANI